MLGVCQNIFVIHSVQIGSFLGKDIKVKLLVEGQRCGLVVGMFGRLRGYERY